MKVSGRTPTNSQVIRILSASVEKKIMRQQWGTSQTWEQQANTRPAVDTGFASGFALFNKWLQGPEIKRLEEGGAVWTPVV